MIQKRKILIIYAKYGDGHYQVARTMQQCLENTGQFDVKIMDVFAESHPMWNAISRFAFHKGSVYCPKLYGWVYALTNALKPNGRFNRWLQLLGMAKMKEIAAREKPDAVIHTFPFLAMSQLKPKSGGSFACLTIVTDYVLHNRWIHPNTDRYFVASSELKDWLMEKGVSNHRIIVSGIPVRSSFQNTIQTQAVFQKYGLNSKLPIVLIMAGANGVFADAATIVEEIMQHEAEVVLVCGKNKSLYHAMSKAFEQTKHVHILGFVEQIEELMSISSCLISKAGGITLEEARTLQLPVVVYRPLPGQEKGNAEYWQAKGFLQIVDDRSQLNAAVQAATQWKLKAKNGNAGGYHDHQSAAIIVQEVVAVINSRMKKKADTSLQGRQIIDEYS
ncbi:glycosyltransferase [Paenibacillus solisilvae]|uniref:Glycosyltransferase n=1 Tax=Paenibacillus solisilvae TaxID=2486751 RepID=A0ABW0VU80_9BACL